MQSEQVVKTKLEPPMIDSQVLFRPSVMKRLKKAKEKPLTLVQAGPGYGKSTAISAFLRIESHPFVWYTVTEQDDHISRFLMYFKEAISSFTSELDDNWLTDVFVNIQRGDEKAIYECCSYFINACVNMNEDRLFIIDDFQHVLGNTAVKKFINWFLLHLPKRIHLVLISRVKLDWDFLASWRVKDLLLEINEDDLYFSPEEIQILFGDHYEKPLSREDAQLIFSKTEGWIIAIQMVRQRLEEAKTLEEIFHDQGYSMEELFQYLALDVLNRQEEKVYQFLIEASIFENVTVDICRQVLHIPDGEEFIFDLLKRNLFLQTTKKKEVFRFHSLFQEFLQSILKKQPDYWKKLQLQAANYYEHKGMLEQTIYHLEQSNSPDNLLTFLHKNGQGMIRQGNSQRLERTFQQLTESEKDRYFRLWIVQGDLERYRSKYEKAISSYKRAKKLAEANGEPLIESMALQGLACVYLDTIQPRHAQDLLKRAIELLESNLVDELSEWDSREAEKQLRQLYILMSENTINLGNADEAKRWFEKSKAFELEEVEKDLEARLHLRTGRLLEMTRRLEGRKKNTDASQKNRPPKSHRETDLLLSYVYALLGRGKEAKDRAADGIMQGVQVQAPFVEACGWMRMGHAIQLQDKYEQRLASTCYQTALEIMEEINISRGKAEPYMGLSLLYGKRKSLEPALKYAELGLKETEKVDDRWLSAWLYICKAIAFVYANEEDRALRVLDNCYESFLLCGDSYGLAVTTMWQAFVAYRLQDDVRFYPFVHQFLQLVEQEGYDDLLQTSTLFGPIDVQQLSPMLLEAYHHQKKEQPFLHHLILQLGMEEGRTSHPGYTLRIQTFQEFKVFRGEEEITERDWKRGKAKELFQLFITKRKHLLQKEEIFELLWENQSGEVATRDFKVALNMLNKVLEPNRKARSTPFFIQRHERAYGLNLAAPFELDTAEFERGVTKGLETVDPETATQFLSHSLSLYEGDYLPERMHEDWCIEERERLQVLYLRGMEKLATLYLQQGKADLCIETAEAILLKDRCWEEAYYLLMEAFRRKQNRGMVLHYFEKCKDVLQKELGVPPMEKTQLIVENMGIEGGEIIDRSGA